ncbi:hypothetical protein HQ590_16875 [bacterium]|nr:hypothetical protein [bacterium]
MPSPVGGRLVLVFVLAFGLSAVRLRGATVPTFDRYQAIIDRAPFGAVAGGRGGEGAVPGFAERYVFVGVVPDVVSQKQQAIVLDKQSNQIQLLTPGETLEDVKVVEIEADGEDSRLILQKGFETATLRYVPRGAAPTAAVPPGVVVAPAGKPAAQAGRPAVPPPPRRIPFRRE